MPGREEITNRVGTASFVPEVPLLPANPGIAPCALLVYIRVHCTAASTIPGSGVQVSFTWNDDAATPQQHDTIIGLDTFGVSSIPELFLAVLGVGEPILMQAALVGNGEFTIEYSLGMLIQ